MFESADGRLSCYKRNSTSLSSRLGQKIVLETYKIKSNMFVIIKILICRTIWVYPFNYF